MTEIPDWTGRPIRVARSRGGVIATVNVFDNLLRADITPWPPPEIVQKLYESRQARAYSGEDGALAVEGLQYYCDLQSLNSEDAITWSVFGPLVYADPTTRLAFLTELCNTLGLPAPGSGPVHAWLWRRFPHPDTRVSGGPEIDFAFQAADLLVLGEAKWRSPVGRGQGASGKKTQIDLRRELCRDYGSRFYPGCTRFLILGVGLEAGMVHEADEHHGPLSVHLRETTWDHVCSLASHPYQPELQRYLQWKRAAASVAV